MFSSHVVSTSKQLLDYMEPRGNKQSFRGVILRELPLVPNMRKARILSPNINPREALYYGLIPSLIHEVHMGRTPVSIATDLAKECIHSPVMTDENVIALLHSFLTGTDDFGMPALLPLMSVGEDSTSSSSPPSRWCHRWIPLLMVEVLREFSNSRYYQSGEIKEILGDIVDLFEAFKLSKEQSGDGWESLFVIALLIRSLTNDFHSKFFPSSLSSSSPCSVSYNRWTRSSSTPEFSQIINLTELFKYLPQPDHRPHIDIYFPSFSNFQKVDVIFLFYDDKGGCHICLYQLKEGEEIPPAFYPQNIDALVEGKIVVRGKTGEEGLKKKSWPDVGEGN